MSLPGIAVPVSLARCRNRAKFAQQSAPVRDIGQKPATGVPPAQSLNVSANARRYELSLTMVHQELGRTRRRNNRSKGGRG